MGTRLNVEFVNRVQSDLETAISAEKENRFVERQESSKTTDTAEKRRLLSRPGSTGSHRKKIILR